MSRRDRRRVLIGLAVLVCVLFAGGVVAAILSRNDTICSDGRVPVSQRAIGLGQIEYLCHNGETVTK
jgi:hypothetical protein